MKILFFVSSMHAGGAERVAATLASAWAARGDQVILVPSYTKKGRLFYRLDRGVKLIWLADRMGWLGKTRLASVRKWFAMRRLVKETRPDVIISFLTNVNVMVLLATRGLGVPTIVCERTNPAVSTSAGKTLAWLRRHTYPWASLVTVQAQASAEPFRKMLPALQRLAVIPNPLPPELAGPFTARPVPDPDQRRRLVAMGRLVPIKRFESLIQAFAALAEGFPEWDLYIWGEGPLRAGLTQQIRDGGLEARAFLPGRSAEPWQELAKADVFVLTSEVEGFPNVLLEAMALGLACVTVDCPSGPREISNDGEDALLVPLGDQQALAGALGQLMADPVLRDVLGKHAAIAVRDRYELHEVLHQWDGLIASVREPQDQEGTA
ncbi:glycosyltransferase family 4 protein [Pollutimonas bauzanensis]|uniref:Glycosyltransferase involved in cell wall bisynthesis n=1 Tax=Pollutimonas bauzanensis TaxID=658167 RepID=A0A1M5PU28_9BURK|nr:glycosyltransferase family 4 protein [Pollutimonas bauzanensis]SHH04989.1 Glycosyltransferase involved in cell wall bisynthesis [Pollutimonas bauzanensis]